MAAALQSLLVEQRPLLLADQPQSALVAKQRQSEHSLRGRSFARDAHDATLAGFDAAVLERSARVRTASGRALDETTLQHLRAIFHANAGDAQTLAEPQLRGALGMLGLRATTAVVASFFARRADVGVDTITLNEFVDAAIDELDRAADIEPDLLDLFGIYDAERTGAITVEALRQLLCGKCSPERLSPDEFAAFLKGAGVDDRDDVRFEYAKYVHNMLVGKPLASMAARERPQTLSL
ncbi:hypothetical protein M885DRAFT_541894 [Pelagophyceae sp. CCMP2097]|nr:hypothetical protein M885DRAFT_541894 [Pelagophyceae sp. CCMP2097]